MTLSPAQDEFTALFADETDLLDSKTITELVWKILLVDDEADIHALFHLVLQGIVVEGRPVQLLDAKSAEQAKAMLTEHTDVALVMLDVVMESKQAGLELVNYIRQVLNNQRTQIILVTGQPGYAPQRKVVTDYEINGYRLKSELTADKIFATVCIAIRTQKELLKITNQKQLLDDANHQIQEDRVFKAYIVESSDDAIISKSLEGIIQSWNKGAEKLFGYTSEEAIGNSLLMLIPADRMNEEQEILAHIARGEKIERFETVRRHKDGRLIDISATLYPIRNNEEKIIGVCKIAEDISEHKASDAQLRIAAAAFDTHEAIMITDSNAHIIRVNRAFENITGYKALELIGKKTRILNSGEHDKAFYQAMWLQLLSTGTWEGELWGRRKSGEIYPKWLRISAIKDALNKTTNYVALFSDITERKQAEEEIYKLAFYDPLTSLPNRRLLFDRLNLALMASERCKQYGALLFLDIDKFKNLNDMFGHDIGDQLLIQVAERIKSCVRKVDVVARFGGDEFVILFVDLGKSAEEASKKSAKIAEKIRATLVAPFYIKQHIHKSSPSIGVSIYYGHTVSSDDLIKQADIAMYQAKNSGRNRVQFFDPVLQQSIEAYAALDSDLRLALSNQQFHLYYQIQTDNNAMPFGAEALIRWIHPERGMISPLQFIPIAEESGFILEIGRWVLETACQQLAKWSNSETTRHLILAINVSSLQFRQTNFVKSIETTIRAHGIEPSRLKLELTESVILHDIEDIVEKMYSIKRLGIKLSLDDFGTGYSSLSYLKRLPIDQIKIDQIFVRDIVSDPNDAVMVKNIIDIAKNFKLNVIAEGVETEEQIAFLKLNGCMAYQGYFFGKPMPIEQFETLLTQSSFG